MTSQESKAINSIRFTCIIFLILLHTRVTHLVPPIAADGLAKLENMLNIPFLPILFLLSGYLFFQNVSIQFKRKQLMQIWFNKLQRRIKTLIIPYIIWCIVAIFYNYLVKGMDFPTNISNFIMQFWDAGTGHPIGKAMWFIKSLILFSILSPLYFYLIKWGKHFILLSFIILTTIKLPIDFPYFNIYLLLGSYIALMGFSLEQIANLFNWRFCLSFYIASKIAQLFFPNIIIPPFFNYTLCIIGLIGIYLRHNLKQTIAVTSSFLYFTHPYFTGIRNIYIKISNTDSNLQNFTIWILTAITVTTICMFLFILLKKHMPKILSILTGDRV